LAMKNAIRTLAMLVMAMVSLYWFVTLMEYGVQCSTAKFFRHFGLVSDADFHCECDPHPDPGCKDRD
jgi:hypothetical protein